MDLLSLLFPRRCVGCGEIGSYLCFNCVNFCAPMADLYCPACRKVSIRGYIHPKCKKNSSLDGVISAYPYKGVIKKAVIRFKYSLVTDLTDTLVELMVTGTNHPILFENQWTIVPIPLHQSRQAWRGFNQAELLATSLAKSWSMNYGKLIKRIKNTSQQMELSGDKRRTNMKGAFEVIGGVPSNILLVDDVTTTCSTLNEAARVLKLAGAKVVWGLTLAQKQPT